MPEEVGYQGSRAGVPTWFHLPDPVWNLGVLVGTSIAELSTKVSLGMSSEVTVVIV